MLENLVYGPLFIATTENMSCSTLKEPFYSNFTWFQSQLNSLFFPKHGSHSTSKQTQVAINPSKDDEVSSF